MGKPSNSVADVSCSPLEAQSLTAAEAEMAKRNSVGSHDMPRQNAFRPAYGTAQDSDDDNSCMASLLTFVSYLLVFITLPISIWGCVKVIENKVALSLSLLLSLCWDDT